MSHYREVMSGIPGPGAHLVITEGDVHALVQTILHPPVLAHRLIEPRRIGWQTADVETMLNRRLALDRAF